MPLFDPEFLELTRDLDLAAYWAENERCYTFSAEKPRCPASFSPDDHWLFEFLEVESTLRYYQDKETRDGLHRQANQLLIEYVGHPYFEEDTFQAAPKRIENLFGCEFAYHEGGTPWLMPVVADESDESARIFSALLDQAEATDMAAWALPEDYCAEWAQRQREGRPLPVLGTGSRGPATIMTSILKPETFFYWSADRPELLRRFSELLAEKMVEFNRVLRAFSGCTAPGWWITDDNSALFNVRLYREYCYPVLERVLSELAPPPANRNQHSDSAMGHLMPLQYALGIRDVNYGPTVDAGLIREKMPEAWIRGQLPPMLLRDGAPDEIRARVVEDFRKAGASGGLEVTTAGSLAAGTGLGRMRWFMKIVQEDCRY
jgi:uroporphyrinogen decarboxylase